MEARFELNRERLLKTFFELVTIDSESGSEGGVTEYLQKWFTDHGYQTVRDEAGKTCGSTGDNLLVHIAGTMPGEAICFNAHQDTVKPGRGIRPRLEGDRVVSGGDTILASDDKAGIAMLLELLERLRELQIPHRELYYLFTIGEEVGMLGAKAFDPALMPCKSFFAIDGTGRPGGICVSGPAAVAMRADFHGRPAHAGIEPEKGASAILMLAEALRNAPFGRIDEETTSNVGLIGGGAANNIVAESARFTAEARSRNEEKLQKQVDAVRAACQQAAEKLGGTVDFQVDHTYPAYYQKEDWFIFRCCEQAYHKEGITPRLVKAGGGGDANVLTGKGYQCGGISAGIYNCHSCDEYLDLNDFEQAYRVVMRMMTDPMED